MEATIRVLGVGFNALCLGFRVGATPRNAGKKDCTVITGPLADYVRTILSSSVVVCGTMAHAIRLPMPSTQMLNPRPWTKVPRKLLWHSPRLPQPL